MAYEPHYRLTMTGTLPDGEIFSNTLNFDRPGFLEPLIPITEGQMDDITADCVNYWGAEYAYMTSKAVLKRVKLARINEDGHYDGIPQERAVNVGGWHQVSFMPHQIARKITLTTEADLGRVKGGFYQPAPYAGGFDFTTNLWSAGIAQSVQETVRTLIENIENAAGVDYLGLRCVVASQGRRTNTGTKENPVWVERLPAGNHDVVGVSCGRRADVQRRRANKLSEARIAVQAVADDN